MRNRDPRGGQSGRLILRFTSLNVPLALSGGHAWRQGGWEEEPRASVQMQQDGGLVLVVALRARSGQVGDILWRQSPWDLLMEFMKGRGGEESGIEEDS